MRRLVTSVFLAALVTAGCGDEGAPRSGSDGSASPSATASSAVGSKPKVTVPSGAAPTELKTRDLRVGTGPAIKPGDRVLVHYVGVAWSTKQEFDASWDSGQPFPVTLGAGMVIEGWDRGLVGMRLGGQRELIIPPDMAYGEMGSPPVIGPNETLVFVVDVIRLA